MIVSEFIEWLKTQDQGAKVEVLRLVTGRDYEGDSVKVVDFEVETGNLFDYTDMRGNQFAKGKPYENHRTLLLGEN